MTDSTARLRRGALVALVISLGLAWLPSPVSAYSGSWYECTALTIDAAAAQGVLAYLAVAGIIAPPATLIFSTLAIGIGLVSAFVC